MLRVLCVAFVLAVAVDTICAIASKEDINKAVNKAMKTSLGDGGSDVATEVNGLAESCDLAFAKAQGAAAANPGGSDALKAVADLVQQAPSNPSFVSCDAFDCPDGIGAFVACLFN